MAGQTLITRRNSIISMVNGSGRFFTVALLIFMMINLAFTFLFEKRYEDFVVEIESVIALKPVIYDDIPNEVWEVIVGRKTVADCEARAMIDAVEEKLTSSSDAPSPASTKPASQGSLAIETPLKSPIPHITY